MARGCAPRVRDRNAPGPGLLATRTCALAIAGRTFHLAFAVAAWAILWDYGQRDFRRRSFASGTRNATRTFTSWTLHLKSLLRWRLYGGPCRSSCQPCQSRSRPDSVILVVEIGHDDSPGNYSIY